MFKISFKKREIVFKNYKLLDGGVGRLESPFQRPILLGSSPREQKLCWNSAK